MNLRWRDWGILVGGVTCSLFLLSYCMAGDWTYPGVFFGFIVLIGLIVKASPPVYLALGLVAPFGVSLMVVKQAPALALVLVISVLAVGIRAVIHRRGTPFLGRFDWLMFIFYGYLLIRYACDPILPGYALGIGDDVTGFRSWLDHFVSLFALLTLGFLITTREDVQKLYSWLAIFSVIIAIVFIPLMFIPGQWLSDVLKEMGVFVTKFGNGWRRFVFLPTMGHFMMMAYWFPTLFRVTPLQARVLFGFGMVAVIAGGGRGAFFSVLIIFVVLSILRRKYLALCVMMLAFGGVILLSNALVQRGYGSSETPWIRVLSAVNPAMAHNIGVDDPIEWRIMRWKRAVEDIKLAPWIGMGYGGISGYFRMLSDVTATSRDLDLERDVATGTTHNGYISLARNLGIPITVLFIIIVLRRMWVHWRQGRRRDHPDKVFLEAHIFFCSYFAMMLAVMMTGAEIRTPVYWAFIALSFIIERLDKESGQSMQTLSRDVTAQNPIAV